MQLHKNERIKRITTCGLLIAVALVLSIVEKMFPLSAVVPIPGIKLGLANVVTLFALIKLTKSDALFVLVVRVILSSLFMGSITGLLFALCGGVLAFVVMTILIPKIEQWFSFCGISIAGAAAHNIGQIGAAILILGSNYVVAYLPFLLFVSIPMGIVTGFLCKIVLHHLDKINV